MNTKMANALAKAYKIPEELMQHFFEITDSFDKRNDFVFFMCLLKYFVKHNILEDDFEEWKKLSQDEVEKMYNAHYKDFYSEAFILLYSD